MSTKPDSDDEFIDLNDPELQARGKRLVDRWIKDINGLDGYKERTDGVAILVIACRQLLDELEMFEALYYGLENDSEPTEMN